MRALVTMLCATMLFTFWGFGARAESVNLSVKQGSWPAEWTTRITGNWNTDGTCDLSARDVIPGVSQNISIRRMSQRELLGKVTWQYAKLPVDVSSRRIGTHVELEQILNDALSLVPDGPESLDAGQVMRGLKNQVKQIVRDAITGVANLVADASSNATNGNTRARPVFKETKAYFDIYQLGPVVVPIIVEFTGKV